MSVTSVAGNNTMSITTPTDEFGWTLAAALTPAAVPAPAALVLFISGLVGLFGLVKIQRSN